MVGQPSAIEKMEIEQSIFVIERILEASLDPTVTITPEDLQDAMEMVLTDMHLRKVKPQYWVDVLPVCTTGLRLAAQVVAEASVRKVEGLPDNVVKLLNTSIEISLKEIRTLRIQLQSVLRDLRECPMPRDTIH